VTGGVSDAIHHFESGDERAVRKRRELPPPLDGRYAAKLQQLQSHFSEYALIRNRVQVEVEWLKALAAEPHFTEVEPFPPAAIEALDEAVRNFSVADAKAVKDIEARTNHDVKAVEYWLCDRFAANRRSRRRPASSTSPARPRTSTTCPMR
jgi:hypothetical protein